MARAPVLHFLHYYSILAAEHEGIELDRNQVEGGLFQHKVSRFFQTELDG